MEIKIGKYIIKSEPSCLWIEEEYEKELKNGKKKIYTKKIAGYSRTFKQLLSSLYEHKIRSSTATEVKKVIKEFEECEQLIYKIINGIDENKLTQTKKK